MSERLMATSARLVLGPVAGDAGAGVETPTGWRPRERRRRVHWQALVIAMAGSGAGLCYNLLATDGIYSPDLAAEPGTISLEEAKSAFDTGQAVFVDARFAWDFAEGHVPGACNVPVGEFGEADAVLGHLPLDTRLITYCTGAECHSSHTLARLLMEELGFRRVDVMETGWPGWKGAQYPVEWERWR